MRFVCRGTSSVTKEGKVYMEIDLLLKIAGVGILLSVINQVLAKAGREDQAMLANITGIVIVLMFLVEKIAALLEMVQGTFKLYG